MNLDIKHAIGVFPQYHQVFQSFHIELNEYPIILRFYLKVDMLLLRPWIYLAGNNDE